MTMDQNMIAYCGAYCGDCDWREATGCPGCKASEAQLFWGTCDKASCAIERKMSHCGECGDAPCGMLKELFADPEHGDGGARMKNLKRWAAGEWEFEKLR